VKSAPARSWIRFDVASTRRGWTSELPAGQYAAWAKFLLEVKDAANGGLVGVSDVGREWCRKYKIAPSTMKAMLDKGIEAKAIKHHNGEGGAEAYYEVVKWGDYQPDKTNAERQRTWRANHPMKSSRNRPVTDRNGDKARQPLCNGDRDRDVDVDVTGTQQRERHRADALQDLLSLWFPAGASQKQQQQAENCLDRMTKAGMSYGQALDYATNPGDFAKDSPWATVDAILKWWRANH